MSNTQPNGRTATLSDIASLRDDFREDLAAAEARLRDAIAAVDAKVTQALNHQAHDLAAHDAAIIKLREETIPEIRQSIVRLEAKLVRLESKLWWLVVAAALGSALSGNVPGALEWVVKRLGR